MTEEATSDTTTEEVRPDDTPQAAAPPEKFWTPLYVGVFLILVVVALAQVLFLMKTFGPARPPAPMAENASPAASAAPSAAPSTEGIPRVPTDAASGRPVPKELMGKLIVPPRVLFRALTIIQESPKTHFDDKQVARIKPLLKKWRALEEGLEIDVLPAVASKIAALAGPQRDFILKVQNDMAHMPPDAPDWEKLLAMLTKRASTKTNPKPEAPAPSESDAAVFEHLQPHVLVTALLKLDTDPSLGLTPSQAAGLVKPITAWKAKDDAFIKVMVDLGDTLSQEQRSVVDKLRSEDTSNPQAVDHPTSAQDALRALESDATKKS